MNKLSRLILIPLLAFASISTQAAAELEIQLGLGRSSANPEQLIEYVDNLTTAKQTGDRKGTMSSATVLYRFNFGLGLGFRGERIVVTKGGEDTVLLTTITSRYGPYLSYRYQGDKMYFGIFGTKGLNHKGRIKVKMSGYNSTWDMSEFKSHSAGLEFGVVLSSWVLGLEAGRTKMVSKEIRDYGSVIGYHGENLEADISGNYGLLVLGYQF